MSNISRRQFIAISAGFLLLTQSATAQPIGVFRDALERAQFEFDRLVNDDEFRARVLRLASVYIDASVSRQVRTLDIVAVDREIQAGNEILRFLSERSFDLSFDVTRLSASQLDDVAVSFRPDGFDRVMRSEFGVSADSEFGTVMLEALAFYAVASAALVDAGMIDQGNFTRGEFCILPFWPFC